VSLEADIARLRAELEDLDAGAIRVAERWTEAHARGECADGWREQLEDLNRQRLRVERTLRRRLKRLEGSRGAEPASGYAYLSKQSDRASGPNEGAS
jgi:elongation factor P--beta-lysine ligase